MSDQLESDLDDLAQEDLWIRKRNRYRVWHKENFGTYPDEINENDTEPNKEDENKRPT